MIIIKALHPRQALALSASAGLLSCRVPRPVRPPRPDRRRLRPGAGDLQRLRHLRLCDGSQRRRRLVVRHLQLVRPAVRHVPVASLPAEAAALHGRGAEDPREDRLPQAHLQSVFAAELGLLREVLEPLAVPAELDALPDPAAGRDGGPCGKDLRRPDAVLRPGPGADADDALVAANLRDLKTPSQMPYMPPQPMSPPIRTTPMPTQVPTPMPSSSMPGATGSPLESLPIPRQGQETLRPMPGNLDDF